MIPGKYIIAGIIVTVIVSVTVSTINEFYSMAKDNGALAANNAELAQGLKDAEADKQSQANEIDHLNELFAAAMKDREAARKTAKLWESKYSEAIENDEDCKKWNDTDLPACVNRLLTGEAGPDNTGEAGKGSSSRLHDAANASP